MSLAEEYCHSIRRQTQTPANFSDAAFSSAISAAIFKSTQGANFDPARILAPYLKNKNGIGASTSAMNPMSVLAHCTPIPWYICVVKSGKAAPTAERAIVLAASADAAYIR